MSEEHEVSVVEAMAGLSPEATTCRDLMHAWLPHTAYELRDKGRLAGYERVLRCRVCGTERTEKLSTWGGLVSRSYSYPDNYLVKGVGRFDGDFKDAARLANVMRGARQVQIWPDEEEEG